MEKLSNIELAAFAFLPQNYVEISEQEHYLQTNDNPLTTCIKKELYELLSMDAKQVITLSLETPMSIYALAVSPKGRTPYIPKKKKTPNIQLIENYLRWVWKWEKLRIRKTLHEISIFVKQIT